MGYTNFGYMLYTGISHATLGIMINMHMCIYVFIETKCLFLKVDYVLNFESEYLFVNLSYFFCAARAELHASYIESK